MALAAALAFARAASSTNREITIRAKKEFGNEFTANRHLKETSRMATRSHYPQHQHRSRNHTLLYIILTIVFIVLGMKMVGGVKDDVLDLQQKQYCKMVALNKEIPDLGWPDYDHRFTADCNADGTVKVQP